MSTDPTRRATLDPADWEAFRAGAHRMLDDMIDYVRDVRDRPAWRKPTEEARARIVDGRLAIRVNPTNHRTELADLHRLLDFVRARGAELA